MNIQPVVVAFERWHYLSIISDEGQLKTKPELHTLRLAIARAHLKLAEMEGKGPLSEACQHLCKAADHLAILVNQGFGGLECQHDLLESCLKAGDQLKKDRKYYEARRYYDLWTSTVFGSLRSTSRSPLDHSNLGVVLDRQALLRLEGNNAPEARLLLTEAIRQQKLALDGDPGNVGFRDRLREHHDNLVEAALCQKDSALAAGMLRIWRDSTAADNQALFRTAQRTARKAESLSDPDPADAARRRQALAALALDLLRAAVDAGYRDLSPVARDPEWEAVRKLPEYDAWRKRVPLN